ncbi:hypothetical protein [Streptomyces sp. ALI-76-A]|uniref:phosphorylase family protein n=1 Tax=Streptomyces sp. ALI-76-A TaxID=3025736 RepID=UPI00256EECC2|nr:hypothetical protein [Streptomyces sp. ALI-76-A]MDL5205241.1 hypothetical protein [Streptomyces sp. ALI-76-A]
MNGVQAEAGTIVVLTALPVEYRAVRDCLVSVRRGPRHQSGTVFELGWLNGTPWRIVLAQTGKGNPAAAALTGQAAEMFDPYAVLLVGVAGRLKPDIELGDVVAATKVYAYHGGKENGEGFSARPVSWPASHELEQAARLVSVDGQWSRALPRTEGRREPTAHLEPIAAGETVLDAKDASLRRLLARHYQDAAAIEMEGAGVAHAAHLNNRLPTLIVRGISDRADGTKEQSDGENWQTTAARSAAAFACCVIRELQADEETPYESVVTAHTPVSPVHRGASRTLAPSPEAPRPWQGGQEVGTPACRYLLHSEHLEERCSPDHSLIEQQALARLLEPAAEPRRTRGAASPYVWLRQAHVRHPVPDALDAVTALAREHDLLGRLQGRSRGLPGTGRHERIGSRRAVLALPWPVGRTGGPCGTLHTAWLTDRRHPLASHRLVRLLAGVTELCDTLAALHRTGATHRQLTPSGVIELGDGRLILRDLGLAGHDPRPGEGPVPYRAPEQWLAGFRPGLIGPPTDVYQLAALLQHMATGHAPDPHGPLPPRSSLGKVPDSLYHALRTALAQHPEDRPGARALGTALRDARADLLGDV